jgi:aminopeptidase YwaD
MGKLHPGADDNASGTSGVLMLADWMARRYERLPDDADARSIVFIAFTAEEGGLNGSRWFVNHPPVPLEKIDLMVNMDMIGRLREDKLDVDGVESAVGFYEWLKPYFEDSGLTIKHSFNIPSNSDHYSFYAKKIPILSLFTGYHDVYHTPADEAHLINAPGAVNCLRLVERIVLASAQRAEGWEFKPSRRPGPREEEKPEQASAPANPGPVRGNVRFGIAPGDYGDDEPGVLVGDVYDGTPAAAAGLKKGDRMVRWNGKPVSDVEGWMPLLAAAKPGDVVDIVVLRDGKEITTKATLTARNETPK